MQDDSLYRGRWKALKHQKNEFSLFREELEKENIWLEYNGIKKVNESYQKYGALEVLEDWEHTFDELDVNIELFSNGGLKTAKLLAEEFGIRWVVPNWPEGSKKGTDFYDLSFQDTQEELWAMLKRKYPDAEITASSSSSSRDDVVSSA